MLIPVKLKLSSFGLNRPFIWHRLISCVIFSVFSSFPSLRCPSFSPSFSPLFPSFEPAAVNAYELIPSHSPCNKCILLLTCAAKHLNAKTQGSQQGLRTLRSGVIHLNLSLNLKSKWYFQTLHTLIKDSYAVLCLSRARAFMQISSR
ncbi:hypothetical protein NL108_007212 [Boleophthalmus pectinirostris]|nr:hypothetical protein NL108_007212 [Boleophthalmus pectinirostris]